MIFVVDAGALCAYGSRENVHAWPRGQAAGLNQIAISRIWPALGLKPHVNGDVGPYGL